jgi:hypothetical protein
MPTLQEYADSNTKDGTFIRASLGDEGVITLQTSPVADRLFGLLEYHPPTTLPSKLVWEMKEVGLLYTRNSIDTEGGGSGDVLSLLDDVDDSSLTPDERTEIIAELETYSGPEKETVSELVDLLGGSSASAPDTESTEPSEIPSIWDWPLDPTLLEYCTDQYRRASLQAFIDHPHLDAPPIHVSSYGEFSYKLSKDDVGWDVYISDHRPRPDHDFKFKIKHTQDKQEFGWITKSGDIVAYENQAGDRGAKAHITETSEWALPSAQILEDTQVNRAAVVRENADGIYMFGDRELTPIRNSQYVNKQKLLFAEVDRLSNADNSVVELIGSGNHLQLDQGEPGERYLIEYFSNQQARVLSRSNSSYQLHRSFVGW